MKNKTVAEVFVKGDNSSKGSNMYIEDNVLYSYGRHFPMAIRIHDDHGTNFFLVNNGKYSRTTSVQQGCLRRALVGEKIIEKDTFFLKLVIDKGLTELKDVLAMSINNEKETYDD